MHVRFVIRPETGVPELRRRAAFTLVELLVAMSIALMVMAAIAQLFSVFGRSFSQSQATVDLSGRMRSAAWQLRQDLAGVTVDVVPPTRPESNTGYFEIVEGPVSDTSLAISGATATSNISADTDDALFFTTRSSGEPFVGRYDTGTIESPCAEVAWFCRPAGSQPITGITLYNLHRRQLLVVGYVGRAPFLANNNSAPVGSLVQLSLSGTRATPAYDLSVRLEGGVAVPNSLGDLTKRENRLFLGGTASIRNGVFPFAVVTDPTSPGRLNEFATFDSTDRVWEDVLLTNVIAFDVRVFDSQALALTSTTSPSLYPGDPGYATTGTGAPGSYVDLRWGGGSPSSVSAAFPPAGITPFQSAGVFATGTRSAGPGTSATYDTWSLHYEFNGVDETGNGLVDEGTNGIDDNGDNIPDNVPEWETSAPYPVPLRGIEVRVRCYEPTSQQVRQITIRHTFIRK
jgi:prepilin-type N-terminal cleavage/methylation domain-containing protein